MDQSSVNTLRAKLSTTTLFIIDKVSMMVARQFYEIDRRLRQIFATNTNFGGKSLIRVRHLRQLPPFGGALLFL